MAGRRFFYDEKRDKLGVFRLVKEAHFLGAMLVLDDDDPKNSHDAIPRPAFIASRHSILNEAVRRPEGMEWSEKMKAGLRTAS